MHYLITFVCYGTHMHGSPAGSIDRAQNTPGTPILTSHSLRAAAETRLMDQAPYHLDHQRRETVLAAIQQVAKYREWNLHALHVRSTHIHAVVEAEVEPERILNDFKAYASRALNQANLDAPTKKRWARHGSTRYLKTPQSISAATQYVIEEQGSPMSAFQPEP